MERRLDLLLALETDRRRSCEVLIEAHFLELSASEGYFPKQMGKAWRLEAL